MPNRHQTDQFELVCDTGENGTEKRYTISRVDTRAGWSFVESMPYNPWSHCALSVVRFRGYEFTHAAYEQRLAEQAQGRAQRNTPQNLFGSSSTI